MAVYGGQNFTSFWGVNLNGTTAFRFAADGGFQSTLAVKEAADAAYAWKLPQKSGTIPIAGTFAVQLPAGVAAFFSTAVTVAGSRAEDVVVAQLTTPASIGYDFDNSTAYVLVATRSRNGALDLFFQNLGNATGYIELVGSYIAAR